MGKKLVTPTGLIYRKPKRWKQNQLPKGKNNGYIDESGWEWVKGPNHHFKAEIDLLTGLPYTYEWDVQVGNETYYNVRPQDGPQ